MYKAKEIAQWFIRKNPNLANGKIDENTKINKLLYFANLMYNVVFGEDLIEEKFKCWLNGPVIEEVYKDYRYGNLFRYPEEDINIFDNNAITVLNIINLLYKDYDYKALSEKTHQHNIWKNKKRNEILDFGDADNVLINSMTSFYEIYKDLDFDNLAYERIQGNLFYYFKDNLKLDDEIIQELCELAPQNEAIFIEKIDGELVYS